MRIDRSNIKGLFQPELRPLPATDTNNALLADNVLLVRFANPDTVLSLRRTQNVILVGTARGIRRVFPKQSCESANQISRMVRYYLPTN